MTSAGSTPGPAADPAAEPAPAAGVMIARKRTTKALRAAQQDKFDAAFRGRKFDIVREVHLPEGQVFKTQFGNYGRRGFILRDRATGEEIVVGRRVLRIIHDRFLGVNLPRAGKPSG